METEQYIGILEYLPVNRNGLRPCVDKTYAKTDPMITTTAFLATPKSQADFDKTLIPIFDELSLSFCYKEITNNYKYRIIMKC